MAWLLVKPSHESFSVCLQRVASNSLLKFGVARSGVESVYFQPALPGACGTDTRLASEQRGLWQRIPLPRSGCAHTFSAHLLPLNLSVLPRFPCCCHVEVSVFQHLAVRFGGMNSYLGLCWVTVTAACVPSDVGFGHKSITLV